ncbi:hypothetical protein PHJA_002325900 [Phtheirospermum japonicum]|uniref:DDE Tnp4 domain-containing protein n=1 Tax=Phtheirospermum japonicum TaxID=374723 RepID=A0A830CS58_9LAMI|nr:hypothetical protein PHJA_002325900 [Phtheirospermum japonicum]
MYVQVQVSFRQKPHYQNCKGEVPINVLGVFDRTMNYRFIFTGLEGSAADSRMLRDAINRPNGFKVPTGQYYICHCGYTSGPGFLAPYRGVRYHLAEWNKRWVVLRSPAFYNIGTQNQMIMACCLLHNFIRTTIVVDLTEHLVEEYELGTRETDVNPEDYIDQVPPSEEWTNWRVTFVVAMYEEWKGVT